MMEIQTFLTFSGIQYNQTLMIMLRQLGTKDRLIPDQPSQQAKGCMDTTTLIS